MSAIPWRIVGGSLLYKGRSRPKAPYNEKGTINNIYVRQSCLDPFLKFQFRHLLLGEWSWVGSSVMSRPLPQIAMPYTYTYFFLCFGDPTILWAST